MQNTQGKKGFKMKGIPAQFKGEGEKDKRMPTSNDALDGAPLKILHANTYRCWGIMSVTFSYLLITQRKTQYELLQCNTRQFEKGGGYYFFIPPSNILKQRLQSQNANIFLLNAHKISENSQGLSLLRFQSFPPVFKNAAFNSFKCNDLTSLRLLLPSLHLLDDPANATKAVHVK